MAPRFMVHERKDEPSQKRSMSAFYTKPASEREATIYPDTIRITRYAPKWARNARRPMRGGMSGAPTGNNGLGMVPAAFVGRNG